MSDKNILAQFDEIFLRECKNKGMNQAEAVGELLTDKVRMGILDNMVLAEQHKTNVVMTVQPGHPILEQMFINQSKPMEGE